jgi:hypothetical protein
MSDLKACNSTFAIVLLSFGVGVRRDLLKVGRSESEQRAEGGAGGLSAAKVWAGPSPWSPFLETSRCVSGRCYATVVCCTL